MLKCQDAEVSPCAAVIKCDRLRLCLDQTNIKPAETFKVFKEPGSLLSSVSLPKFFDTTLDDEMIIRYLTGKLKGFIHPLENELRGCTRVACQEESMVFRGRC
jgi:hypothetical protein